MHYPQAALTSPPSPTLGRLYKILILLWAALCVLSAGAQQTAAPAQTSRVPVPPYSARVLDTTKTLSTQQIAALNEQILALEADTRAAVVVFMLRTTGEDAIEEYATRVFEKWKLGDAQRDDGILVLVALEDRRMRIEVGQGLEGAVPDLMAARIIDQQMKPRFRDKDYAGGLEAAIHHIGARVRGDVEPPDASPRGITPFGWAFIAALLWGFAVGVIRARRTWKWQVTMAVAAAVPVVAALVLKSPAIAAVLLSFPVPLAFALGFGCGRSRAMRLVTGGIALAIVAMVAMAYKVGADRFWGGLVYIVGGGIGCVLLGLIAVGIRTAWKRSLVELGVRSMIVAAIVGYVAFENPPGPFGPDWTSWLPTGMAFGLAMLFGFFPAGADSSSGRDDRRSSSSGSRSSSSSSSRSSSGGSSSGGGASGSW